MNNYICNRNELEPNFYAGFSMDKDNIEKSSSGGIFYELCKRTIDENGVVYGAIQASITSVEHMRADTLEEAKKFRRSKYLKSKMNSCYLEVKADLDAGRKVLFSGVPCQVAALYRYLNSEYENLFTVEVVCHGIPHTDVFKEYVEKKSCGEHGRLVDICFRDKSQGWKNNSIREYYEDGNEYVVASTLHPVHSLYIKGINMEKKCASCAYAKLPRVADITLADFWQYKGGLAEKINDRGISLIVVNNKKGEELMNGIKNSICYEEVEQADALISCRHMSQAPLLGKSHRAFEYFKQNKGISFAMDICGQFGDVVLADELCKITNHDDVYVRNILQEDTQEIVYYVDEKDVLQGIVTFGAFIQAYLKDADWINYNFGKVVFSDNCVEDVREIFGRSEKILRVPVVDGEGRLLFEVRRTNGGNGRSDSRKGIFSFIDLKKANVSCYFCQRPDFLQDYNYNDVQKRHIEDKCSFPRLSEDIVANEAIFQEILGNKYSVKYVEDLCKISPIIPKGRRYVHVDTTSPLINVVGGLRVTCGQPEQYGRTIHVYGRCGAFGYAVEDAHTMPSQLQSLLKDRNIRVVNHGTWGADDVKILSNLYWDIQEKVIEEGDIVLIYMRYLPYMEQLHQLGVKAFDTTKEYYEYLEAGGMFYDIPGHMTAEGYEFVAQYIYRHIKDEIEQGEVEGCHFKLTKPSRPQQNADNIEEIAAYITSVKSELPSIDFANKKVGAIVMNCNPFTNGHKYLIETARRQVDVLLIFVLEEDKSYFSYKDRMAMVKLGTAEMDNVYVLPSGKFMISALTFPEYFLKEQQQEVVINPAMDVEIFGRYIAPEFNISVRFVGTEPVDNVTNQYNQSLKKLLPEFGVCLLEIPRLECEGKYVTATEVRQLLQNQEVESIKKIVPKTTWKYMNLK